MHDLCICLSILKFCRHLLFNEGFKSPNALVASFVLGYVHACTHLDTCRTTTHACRPTQSDDPFKKQNDEKAEIDALYGAENTGINFEV